MAVSSILYCHGSNSSSVSLSLSLSSLPVLAFQQLLLFQWFYLPGFNIPRISLYQMQDSIVIGMEVSLKSWEVSPRAIPTGNRFRIAL